jgi:hypothetical protein
VRKNQCFIFPLFCNYALYINFYMIKDNINFRCSCAPTPLGTICIYFYSNFYICFLEQITWGTRAPKDMGAPDMFSDSPVLHEYGVLVFVFELCYRGLRKIIRIVVFRFNNLLY